MLSNRFEVLNIEDELCNINTANEDTLPVFCAKHSSSTFCNMINNKKKDQKKKSCMLTSRSNSKEKLCRTKIFESQNRSSLFEDWYEENLEKLMEYYKILTTSKSGLKKCKLCSYKKRVCAISKTNCTSTGKKCVVCQKVGHFPNSLNCSKRKSLRRVISQSENIKSKNIMIKRI